jgi:hypothetical protein
MHRIRCGSTAVGAMLEYLHQRLPSLILQFSITPCSAQHGPADLDLSLMFSSCPYVLFNLVLALNLRNLRLGSNPWLAIIHKIWLRLSRTV